MTRTWRLMALTALLATSGCKDKAEPSYKACLNYLTQEAYGGGPNYQAATDACKQAVAADPTSASGKAAAAKMRAFHEEEATKCTGLAAAGNVEGAKGACTMASMSVDEPDLKKQVEDAFEKINPLLQRGQADAAQNAMKAARAVVNPKAWGWDRDATCTAKGLPPYRKDYGGGTLAQDQLVAAGDGCQALFSSSDPTLAVQYCCPK